jgi:hypothetical protein
VSGADDLTDVKAFFDQVATDRDTMREKAHDRPHRPFHSANVRKVRDNAEVARRLVEDEKTL